MNLLLALLFLSLLPAAPGPGLVPPPAPDGWVGPTIRTFEREDLFNHINGGAEIFLEAGFAHLTVCQYRHGGTQTLDLEAYRFNDPRGALAMFLQLRAPGRQGINPGQISRQQGSWLLLLNNPSGNPEHLPLMNTLLQRVAESLPSAPIPPLFEVLPSENRLPGSERLVYGPYSLQNLFTLGEGDMLLLQENRLFAPSAQYGPGPHPWTLLRVQYPDEHQAREALAWIRSHLDPYLDLLTDKTDHLIIRDFRQRYGEIIHQGSLLILRWDLEKQPY